jgi:hypothetical protein
LQKDIQLRPHSTALPEYNGKEIPDLREYKGSSKLAGKAALITGGDSGIGRAVAILVAREGADVAINYLPQEQTDAEAVKAQVEKEGRKCVLIPQDIGGEEVAPISAAQGVNGRTVKRLWRKPRRESETFKSSLIMLLPNLNNRPSKN